MTESRFTLMVQRDSWGTTVTLSELAREIACPPSLIERLESFGVVEALPESGSEMLFPASAVRRLKRALRLRHDLGISNHDLALVLDLLDRIDNLEDELHRMRDEA